jgi:hypothetical protein
MADFQLFRTKVLHCIVDDDDDKKLFNSDTYLIMVKIE